jgi:hypothetical protein
LGLFFKTKNFSINGANNYPMNNRVYRPRLNSHELQLLVTLCDARYRNLKRVIREEREKIKAGWPDFWLTDFTYPFAEKVRDLECLKRILKKLNRLLTGRYVINPNKENVAFMREVEKFQDYQKTIKEITRRFTVLGINPAIWWIYFGEKSLDKAKCEDCKKFKAGLCKEVNKDPFECMRETSTAIWLKYTDLLLKNKRRKA